jgi:pilus assembly protein CpaE
VYPLSIGVVIATKDLWEKVQHKLHSLPARVVLQETRVENQDAFSEKLQHAKPELLLLDVAALAESVEDVVRRIKSLTPAPFVCVMDAAAHPETIVKAMRAGANEFIYPPIADGLDAALNRAAAEQHAQVAKDGRHGRILGFFSAKGGCGATTLACHIALEISHATRQRVLLADFDLDSGLIGFLMRSKSPYSLLDAIKNINRLDSRMWKALVSNGVAPGLEVVTAPDSPAERDLIGGQQLRSVLRFSRSEYDWTVVDLGRGVNPDSMAALEEVDEVFLITTLEVPTLHQAKQVIQKLLDAGCSRDKLRLVLNRMPKNAEITVGELERMLDLAIYKVLPSDYAALYESYADRKLLPRDGRLGRHIAQLAAKIAGVEEPKTKKKFSLFG